MELKIDHILLGISDLEVGSQEFESLTGVRPIFGGVHPNIGTHNALVSLGNGIYLEIIAPQKKGKKLTGPFRGFENMDQLGLIGWALQTSDLSQAFEGLEESGVSNSGIQPGSRKTPQNDILEWATIFPLEDGLTVIQPFFINWKKMDLHPSLSTPPGCSLEHFKYANDHKDPIGKFLDLYSICRNKEVVENKPSGHISEISLRTPKGLVSF